MKLLCAHMCFCKRMGVVGGERWGFFGNRVKTGVRPPRKWVLEKGFCGNVGKARSREDARKWRSDISEIVKPVRGRCGLRGVG
jgi:hypothetical protein